MREIRVNNVAHWQSDRSRQPRHAASFLGDVAIRGEGKGVRRRPVPIKTGDVSASVCGGDSASWVQ